MWSLGTIFFEMLTGFSPFTGMNKEDLKVNLESGNYMFPKHIKLNLEGLDFLNCCLQHNPKERMSWEQLSQHSYLNYDFTRFMDDQLNKKGNIDQSELLLSYNEDSGVYSAIMQNNPQYQLNQNNAILLNTKNPAYFAKLYENTLMKKYANEVQEHA